MNTQEAWTATLQAEFNLNADVRFPELNGESWDRRKYPPESVVLSEDGADFTPIHGHKLETGSELVRRLDLARRRIKALEVACEHTTALLAKKYSELQES